MMKRQREDVLVRRAVCVERIPDGSPIDLVVEGQLVRLRGADADAIGKKEPAALALPEVVEAKDVSDLVWQTLRTCYDPEIPVNIVELGLIYRCVLEPLEDTEKVGGRDHGQHGVRSALESLHDVRGGPALPRTVNTAPAHCQSGQDGPAINRRRRRLSSRNRLLR